MSTPTLIHLEKQIQKLLKTYKKTQRENIELKKQLSVSQMEHTMLQEKHHQANIKIKSLLEKLSTLEGHM